jgi:hypothetical protein
MRYKFKVLFLVVILIASCIPVSFAQYASLVGKWVKINGPLGVRYIGVGSSEEACERLIVILQNGKKRDFIQALESFDVVVTKNYTSAIVLDAKILEGKAKVTLLSGLHKGASGWIPIKWLGGNKEKVSFTGK